MAASSSMSSASWRPDRVTLRLVLASPVIAALVACAPGGDEDDGRGRSKPPGFELAAAEHDGTRDAAGQLS